jgi:SulP family sulfate permease
MGGGTVVGEIGLYLHQIRTASIVTDTHSVVYCLQASALARMEKDDPDLASALHHWMARLLAERLSENNKTLEALLS